MWPPYRGSPDCALMAATASTSTKARLKASPMAITRKKRGGERLDKALVMTNAIRLLAGR